MRPLDTQVGGDHYKLMKIQPLEFIMANQMSYCEANVVKYISRWRTKNGVEDLRKARHYIDLLIEEATEDTLDVLQSQHTNEPIDRGAGEPFRGLETAYDDDYDDDDDAEYTNEPIDKEGNV